MTDDVSADEVVEAVPLVVCPWCHGKGHVPGDPEGAPIEDCKPCNSTGKRAINMNAYYYGFGSVGVPAIDVLLSAVACAGKAYHHTESWDEQCEPYHELLRGNSPTEWIQNAAEDAAKAFRTSTHDAAHGGWRPIAEAPKTGDDLVEKLILGYCTDEHPNDRYKVCWWEPLMKGGIWWSDADVEAHPIAWMPLPTPPSPKSGG